MKNTNNTVTMIHIIQADSIAFITEIFSFELPEKIDHPLPDKYNNVLGFI